MGVSKVSMHTFLHASTHTQTVRTGILTTSSASLVDSATRQSTTGRWVICCPVACSCCWLAAYVGATTQLRVCAQVVGPLVSGGQSAKDFHDNPRIKEIQAKGYEWAYMQPVGISISITWMHFLRKKKPVLLAGASGAGSSGQGGSGGVGGQEVKQEGRK